MLNNSAIKETLTTVMVSLTHGWTGLPGKEHHYVLRLNTALQKAIDLALGGDWTAAHEIVQESEKDPAAAWIHAVLHKIEGDVGNARYWYRRAGKMENLEDEPRSELATIKNLLMEKQ